MESVAEARLSRARSEELERLLRLGTALASALDEEALQSALCQRLPAFFGDRGYWLLARKGTAWVEIAQMGGFVSERSVESQEQFAEQMLRDMNAPDTERQGVELEEVVCFPLMVGPTVVGVLGVENTPRLSSTDRIAATAAAAPMALALRSLRVVQDLQQQGSMDQLTGCLNRATGVMELQGELRRARRSRRPISIMMIDIDNFKSVNDMHGHLAGDAVLGKVGELAGQALRTTDVRCRFGGDEFLLILPETALPGAERAATKLQAAMTTINVGTDEHARRTTISIGIAQAERGELDVSSLIGRADAALYRAKHAGRDQFCVAETQVPEADHPERQPVMTGTHTSLLLESAPSAMTPEYSRTHRVA